MVEKKRTYHGWIVCQKSPGFNDTFYIEHPDKSHKRVHRNVGSGSSGAVAAVEYFDKLTGRKVSLEQTPLGAYRVYTEEDN